MELKKWAKTLLTSYSTFETIAGALDKYIEARAFASMQTNIMNAEVNKTMCVYNDMARLMAQKIDLINLKVLVDNILDAMKPKFARCLALKYFDGLCIEECAEVLEISPRSVARFLALGIEAMVALLRQFGYDEHKLVRICGANKWIVDFCKSPLSMELCGHVSPELIRAKLVAVALGHASHANE